MPTVAFLLAGIKNEIMPVINEKGSGNWSKDQVLKVAKAADRLDSHKTRTKRTKYTHEFLKQELEG